MQALPNFEDGEEGKIAFTIRKKEVLPQIQRKAEDPLGSDMMYLRERAQTFMVQIKIHSSLALSAF